MNIVAEKTKIILQRLDIKASVLAKELGVTQTAISDMSNGRVKNFSGSVVELLKLKYNINPDWLTKGEGEMFLPQKAGELSFKEKELLEYFRQNPEWLQNLTLGALKGGESAADLVKALSSLSEPEQKIVIKMIQGLQH